MQKLPWPKKLLIKEKTICMEYESGNEEKVYEVEHTYCYIDVKLKVWEGGIGTVLKLLKCS